MPSESTQFLTHDEVFEIQSRLAERFGGQAGIRDSGLLVSALYRPQTGYFEDLTEMGAALFESLIMNHPFIDRNKPVAFFGIDVFFRLNGYKLKVDPVEAHSFLIELLGNDKCDFNNLLPWIRQSIVCL